MDTGTLVPPPPVLVPPHLEQFVKLFSYCRYQPIGTGRYQPDLTANTAALVLTALASAPFFESCRSSFVARQLSHQRYRAVAVAAFPSFDSCRSW
jgi:hypothetical protein